MKKQMVDCNSQNKKMWETPKVFQYGSLKELTSISHNWEIDGSHGSGYFGHGHHNHHHPHEGSC